MKQKQNRNGEQQQQTTQQLLRLCSMLLLMALVWAGCKQSEKLAASTNSEQKAAADTNPFGTYTLVSVNGNTLPYALQHEGATPTIKSGSFIINSNGTCISKVNFSMPSGGDNSREVKATYTQEGQKFTMKWEGAGMTVGTVQSNMFTMDNEGMVFAYRK
jgi:hypothetical protein